MVFSEIISFERPYKKKGAPSCGLYLRTPEDFHLNLFLEQARRAFKAINESPYEKNMHALELTMKNKDLKKYMEVAESLVSLCHRNGIVLILENEPEIAASIGADGVRLNKVDIKKARKIMGVDAIIGVHCKNSKSMAKQSIENGADYVLFSKFYTKHKQSNTATIPLLEWWGTMTHLPAVAIGNITPENSVDLVRAGAGFIAADSYVWENPDGPAQAIYKLTAYIDHALSNPMIN